MPAPTKLLFKRMIFFLFIFFFYTLTQFKRFLNLISTPSLSGTISGVEQMGKSLRF